MANDDHDVKEKKRKLSNSSQKSQKLPFKHHRPQHHEQNHIFRLKLSPEAKQDVAVSNRSKQSFYSSR